MNNEERKNFIRFYYGNIEVQLEFFRRHPLQDLNFTAEKWGNCQERINEYLYSGYDLIMSLKKVGVLLFNAEESTFLTSKK